MASTSNQQRVQDIYIAYYGRPADPPGLAFWSGRLESADGDLAEIIAAFSNSEEFLERFGGLTPEQLIDNLYQQSFG